MIRSRLAGALAIAAILTPCPQPAGAAESAPTCYVAQALPEGARFRKSPSLRAPVAATAERGKLYPVIAAEGEEDWARISEGPNQGLFLNLSVFRVKVRDELEACRKVEGPAEVGSDRVNVRSAPDMKAAVTGQLRVGDPLTVSPAEAPWLQITFPEEHKGRFVHSDFVKVRLPRE